MADLESFSASMAELEEEMTQLYRQLSEETQRAGDLELSASSIAKKIEEAKTDISSVISDICVLEMEAEDLASLQPHEYSPPFVGRPGQKGGTEQSRVAILAASSEFAAACSSFRDRHNSSQQKAAAVKAQERSLSISQRMSQARAALSSAERGRSSTREQLGMIIEASSCTEAHCEELHANLNEEVKRGARLQREQKQLEVEQRKALEEAEKELCASTLQDEATLELQKEIRTLKQEAWREGSTAALLRDAVKSKEIELATLQRSLQALAEPAQPGRSLPAVISRLTGSAPPDNCSTGVFCKDSQPQAQLQCEGLQQGPRDRQLSTAVAESTQQPRPVSSLTSSLLQQRSHRTVRQLDIPHFNQLHNSSPFQPRAGPHHIQHARPGLESLAEPQHSKMLSQKFMQVQSGRHSPGRPAWQQAPLPHDTRHPGTKQHTQGAVQKTLTAYPAFSHTQLPASRSAGRTDTHISKEVAQQPEAVAALPVSLHQGDAKQLEKQPGITGHPATPASLEPLPYIVQEPDSPTLQDAERMQCNSAMSPTCIFMETTITRTITPGQESARAESTWTIRKVHDTGRSAGQCPGSADRSFSEDPDEARAREHYDPRSDSLGKQARGKKTGGRSSRAKGPRKRLKSILGSNESLAIYQPEVARECLQKAQLEAEDDVLLSSLW